MASENGGAEQRKEDRLTVSIVSHRQAPMCQRLVEDLAAHASDSIDKVVLTLNVPEPLPEIGPLPFDFEVVFNRAPQGFGENHNQAFARAKGSFFAVLNPDLRVSDDPFPPLVERLADPNVGIVAPKVFESDGSLADSARSLVSPWEVLARRMSQSRRSGQIPSEGGQPDWLAGIFLAFRNATYERLGGFDTRYFLYCEDVDICARARLMGLRLEFVREAKVVHDAQRASHRALRYTRMHMASLIKLWSSPVYRDYSRMLQEAADKGTRH